MERTGSETYNNKSSAKSDNLNSVPSREIPVKMEEDLRKIDKGSIASANNGGDNGHPCLVPRARVKKLDWMLLVEILACGDV